MIRWIPPPLKKHIHTHARLYNGIHAGLFVAGCKREGLGKGYAVCIRQFSLELIIYRLWKDTADVCRKKLKKNFKCSTAEHQHMRCCEDQCGAPYPTQ